jgi:serine/threonine-protein kinase HipA
LKAVQQLASAAGYASWKQVQGIISDIADAIFNFKNVAQSLDINKQTIRLIEQQLNNTHAINKHLITG